MQVGDPTIIGWLTVVFYFIAVVCVIRQARIAKVFGASLTLWYMLAAFLLFLGINKQLDLQTWFLHSMKDIAVAHGWYEHRRPVQIAFVAALGAAITIAIISMRLLLANSWRSYKITWIGMILLCLFILIRAVTFSHVGAAGTKYFLSATIDAVLEIGALILVIAGTFINKQFIYPLNAFTANLKDYVEISAEGNPVQCPQCSKQPLAKPVDGRMFKCKGCGYHYTVRVVNRKS